MCLKRLRKTTKSLSQDSWPADKDFNLQHPKCEPLDQDILSYIILFRVKIFVSLARYWSCIIHLHHQASYWTGDQGHALMWWQCFSPCHESIWGTQMESSLQYAEMSSNLQTLSASLTQQAGSDHWNVVAKRHIPAHQKTTPGHKANNQWLSWLNHHRPQRYYNCSSFTSLFCTTSNPP
jgi:hypothetical protein